MSEDRILQCHIPDLPSPLIETYLRKVGFLHVALVGRECKLDPKLINALMERWRLEMHTFHLPCDECTIILEYVHLQLWLSMDEARIEMAWLQNNFAELAEDLTEEERERYARAYILQIIRVILMPELDDLHRIKLQLPNMNWSIFHLQYTNMWNNLYDFLPTSENIIVLELACDPDYMSWFRIHGKSYLYGEKARRRHPHTSRPRWDPLNLKGDEAGPSSTPTQELTPMTSTPIPTPPSVSWTVGHPSSMWYTSGPSYFSMTVMSMMMYSLSMHEAPTESPLVIQSAYGTQHSYTHSS
ncbi:hypothetical protein Gogos_021343 [Gossypium gossypioides]|uniref:Aminotransferase-like plant mobile domain-containing protein n=1 Tax=Gossypium gossypioides TaxID=34282 RepID=A0A7J9D6D9_GOSGO|nr:hypothetical protein [Gossypium gossypioides]